MGPLLEETTSVLVLELSDVDDEGSVPLDADVEGSPPDPEVAPSLVAEVVP